MTDPKIRIGQLIKVYPEHRNRKNGSGNESAADWIYGTVVYINQKHKYFMVEYKTSAGAVMHESFKMDGLDSEIR